MTDPIATADVARKQWPDLSPYGIKLFLLRAPDRTVHLLAGGRTDDNASALMAYGMQQHPKNGRWHLSFKPGERMSFKTLRDAFPLMTLALTDPSTFIVAVTRTTSRAEVESAAAADAPAPAPAATTVDATASAAPATTEVVAPATDAAPFAIALPSAQRGKAERDAATVIASLGLTERIAKFDDDRYLTFHATVRNAPFMDLVIERLPAYEAGGTRQHIMLTHYRRQNGDSILDAEAVFRINADGTLTLVETAVENPVRGGESRGLDRTFAAIFMRNLVTQGFGTGELINHSDGKDLAPEPEGPASAPDAGIDDELPDDLAALAGMSGGEAPPMASTTTSPPDDTGPAEPGTAAAEAQPAPAPAPASKPEKVTIAASDTPDVNVDPMDYASALLDVPQEGRLNYRVSDPDTVLRGQWNERLAIEGNLKALRVLKTIETTTDDPTQDDLDALIGYVGWGGLPGMFAEENPLFKSYNHQLRALVDEGAYLAMRASTMNAHYTNYRVIDAMWAGAIKAGFTGGRVLEAGAGNGLFLARCPDEVQGSTRFVAVEKDVTSARLLKALYPRAKVFAAGYEHTAIPDASVDMVIGNVPFGAFKVFDPEYKKLDAYIHDYFIAKSMDKLRPGGILMCITGTGTLDRQNPKIREAIHAQGDLMAAYRLPRDAFKGNANTEVTTDILVIRKRLADDKPREFVWRDCVALDGADGTPVTMNGVYTTAIGHVLGHIVTSDNMYGGTRNTVTRTDPRGGQALPLVDWIAKIPATMPEQIHAPMTAKQLAAVDGSAMQDAGRFFDAASEGAFVVIDRQHVGLILHGKPQRITGLVAKDEQRIRDYIPLRDAVAATIQAQLDGCDDSALAAAQVRLDATYDSFVKAHGRIAEGRRNKNRTLLQDDPVFDAVHALEVLDDENRFTAKAEIFTARTVGPRNTIRCESAHDALIACIDQTGAVDPDWIALHAERPWAQCVAELKGQIYRDPATGAWDLAARYLSGNVRAKLRIAESAALDNPALTENVEALTERLPQWLTRDEISVSLGMRWIESDMLTDFLHHVYDTHPLTTRIEVSLSVATGTWNVSVPKYIRSEGWDTPRMAASELIEHALNGKAAKVTRPADGDDKKRVVDEVATAIAIEKQRGLKELFATWVWNDPQRATRLEAIYNETFNSMRSADYRNIPITVSGMATNRALRGHQAAGLARCVLDANVALAHPVGFGKTATISATAMKLRQVFGGKSMVCTPKNVISQFAGEVKRWFPTARVLTMKSEDLTPTGRSRFWRRVQVTNPDIIITTPEAFKRLRLPKDAEVRFLMNEITQFEAQVAASRDENATARRIKQMESALAGKCAQLSKLMNLSEKDDSRITLADLGITAIMVDEAHRYKNLRVDSSEQILGIPSSASQRAFDMLAKVRYIQENDGKVIFATGSLITNTIAEVFNMQRYLQPELLETMGVQHFDGWRSQFADTLQSLEPDPAGKGYRIVNRLAEIRNVPELVRMLAQFVDAVADNNAYFERPTPKFEVISIEPTDLQVRMRESLAERVQLIREKKGPPQKGDDNILCVLGDARRGALDLRTLYPSLPEDVGGTKLSEVARNVAEIYQRSGGDRGAQAVFLDIATPRPASQGGFNGYDALTAKLVKLGVPRNEIAYIHDAKTDPDKLALYRRVREGSLRVLVGSTEKMGEGANIQDRLAALHHLNAPYHPGAVTQRNGRIIRNGNLFRDVAIFTYVTKGMLEDWNWHLVTLKAGFIGQVMDGMASGNDGAGLARKIVEDAGSMSFEEIEAEASDNPMVRRKCIVDTEVRRLDLLRSAWGQQRSSQSTRIEMAQGSIERAEHRVRQLDGMQATIDAAAATREQRHLAAVSKKASETDGLAALGIAQGEGSAKPGAEQEHAAHAAEKAQSVAFVMTVGSRDYAARKDAGNALLVAAVAAQKESYKSIQVLGEIDGIKIVLRTSYATTPVMMLTPAGHTSLVPVDNIDISLDPLGMTRRIEYALAGVRREADAARDLIARKQCEIAEIKAVMSQTWPHEATFAELRREQSEINIALARENHCASGEGIKGFMEALAQYHVDVHHKAQALDDFDVAAALADLGELEALPESDDDDAGAPEAEASDGAGSDLDDRGASTFSTPKRAGSRLH